MDNNYINFYNNLVNLTRNKIIYKDFTNQDTFSDRLIVFLFHYAFFLNVLKSNSERNINQSIFDSFGSDLYVQYEHVSRQRLIILKNDFLEKLITLPLLAFLNSLAV